MNHRRIDVHHDILPPSSVAWLRSQGVDEAGGRQLPDWSLAPSAGVGLFAGMLDAYPGLDDAGQAAIHRASAERLFPRFTP